MRENQINDTNAGIQTVLITGGSGPIGRYLTTKLIAEGFNVSLLSRKPGFSGNVNVIRWDPSREILSQEALNGIDFIVHLAGANIGEKRWTAFRRNEILSSRIDSASLLFKTVNENKLRLKAFISASAVGYYGAVTTEKIFSEEDPPSEDFTGRVCRSWEKVADLFAEAGIRTVKIRTAVVLSKNDSVLTRLMTPARFGLVVRLGNGTQYFPWIHIDDLCNIYLKAIQDINMNGPYNAVAPGHVNHNEFVRTMAKVMNRPVFLPPVPSLILRAVFGEMSDIVLKGSRISPMKIINAGYNFRFASLDDALKNIILT